MNVSKITEEYLLGDSINTIARRHKIAGSTVWKILKQKGIKTRDRSEMATLAIKKIATGRHAAK